MLSKNLEAIELADLEALVTNGVSERGTIDFKLDLPGGTNDDKREFLADVSSFANTAGGDLLFGIREKNGAAIAVCGVSVPNFDALKLEWENRLRDSLQPRLPAIDIRAIECSHGLSVVMIRVRKSWNGPHRVIFNGHGHFYARNSAGKYRLDVPQLRDAFTLSEAIVERIRGFRADRVAKVCAGETPVPLNPEPKLIFHVVPLSAFAGGDRIDVATYRDVLWKFRAPSGGGHNSLINLDGQVNDAQPFAYAQVFRNRVVEGVSCLGSPEEYHADYHEPHLVEALSQYLPLLRNIGASVPIYLFLAFVGVRGYRFGSWRGIPRAVSIIREDVLVFPEAVVETFEVDPATVLKPIFDVVWNAFGFERCGNYDDAGRWRPPQR